MCIDHFKLDCITTVMSCITTVMSCITMHSAPSVDVGRQLFSPTGTGRGGASQEGEGSRRTPQDET